MLTCHVKLVLPFLNGDYDKINLCLQLLLLFKIGDFSVKKVKLSWQQENKINHGLTALFGGFRKLNCDSGVNGTNLLSILRGISWDKRNMF